MQNLELRYVLYLRQAQQSLLDGHKDTRPGR